MEDQSTLNTLSPEKTSEIRRLMEKMESNKEKFFRKKMQIFEYYVYGHPFQPNDLDTIYTELPSIVGGTNLNVKTDGTIQSIVDTATGMYVSAILPRSVNSIKIIDKENQELSSNQSKQINKLEKLLHDFLEIPELAFNYAFYHAVGEYLNFGNVLIRMIDGGKIVCIPFKNVYFHSEYTSERPILAYKIEYVVESIIPILQDYFGIEGAKSYLHEDTIEIHHIFLPSENGMITEYVTIKDHNMMMKHKTYSKENFPIFTAREIKTDPIYGIGSGIACIANIYHANVYMNLKNMELKLMNSPSILMPEDSQLNSDRTIVHGNSLRLNTYIHAPAQANIDHTPPGSSRKVELLFGDPGRYQMQHAAYLDMLMQIEKSYNVDIFKLAADGSPRTATEIIEKKNVAIRVFNGKSRPFYNELLYPLLNFIMDKYVMPRFLELLKSEGMPYELKNPVVIIESFATEQEREIKTIELQNLINLSAGFVQMPELQQSLAEGGFFEKLTTKLNDILNM
jgi:hypothetical protein